MTKCEIIFSVKYFFVVIINILLISFVHSCFNSNTEDDENLCTSKQCNEYGKYLNDGMDYTIDPCRNFYDFVCGNYAKSHRAANDTSNWSTQLYRDTEYKKRLSAILIKRESRTDKLELKMAKKWYKSCTDIDAIAKRGLKPIRRMLDEVGGWPLIDGNWTDNDKENWHNVIMKYHKRGIMSLLDLSFIPNCENSNKFIPSITWNIFDEEVEKDFKYLLIYTVEEFLSVKLNKNFPKHIFHNIEEITKLHDIISKIKRESSRTICDKKGLKTIADIEKRCSIFAKEKHPVINILLLLNSWLADVKMKLEPTDTIYVQDYNSLIMLCHVLSTTPDFVLINYIHYSAVLNFLLIIMGKENNIIKRYQRRKMLKGSRELICVNTVPFRDILAEEFIKKYMSSELITKGANIIDRIHLSMMNHIRNIDWLDRRTRAFMIQKYGNVKKIIGMPGSHDKTFALQKMNVSPHFIDNMMEYHKHSDMRIKIAFAGRMPYQKWPGIVNPTSLIGFYDIQFNGISISVSLFSEPFFSTRLPLAVNYATTGFIIGHEYSHAIDTEGMGFDDEGLRRKNDYISSAYHEKVQCLIQQYDTYGYRKLDGEEMDVDGYETKNENLADNIGLYVTYYAFITHLRESIDRQDKLSLPHFECFTNEQMFFISYANYWCENDDIMINLKKLHPHAPNRFRILGTITNSEEFSEVFNCASGTQMNPKHKCTF